MTPLGGTLARNIGIRAGGEQGLQKPKKAKGGLTVRERLALLLDRCCHFGLEFGLWAAHRGVRRGSARKGIPLRVNAKTPDSVEAVRRS